MTTQTHQKMYMLTNILYFSQKDKEFTLKCLEKGNVYMIPNSWVEPFKKEEAACDYIEMDKLNPQELKDESKQEVKHGR